MTAPTTSAEFDRAYRMPITPWGDFRIPAELAALVRDARPGTSLELGCGVGRFSRWVAQQGVRATAVDFSPVAIGIARESTAGDARRADYLVGNVTDLRDLQGPFDVSFDVGCFHCLDAAGQRAYAAELARLLVPGGTHLLWALDTSPSDLPMSPETVSAVFSAGFTLRESRASRRRLVASRWYWLTRA